MTYKKRLDPGEVEITWINGSVEYIKAKDRTYNAGAIVLEVEDHRIIIPLYSVKKFRVRS